MSATLTLRTLTMAEPNEEDMRNFSCFVKKHCTALHRFGAFCIRFSAIWNGLTSSVKDDIKIYTKQKKLPQPPFAKRTVYSAMGRGKRIMRLNDDNIIQNSKQKIGDDQFAGHKQESTLGEHRRTPKIIEKC